MLMSEGARLDGDELPLPLTPGIDLKCSVVARDGSPVIVPTGGVVASQHGGVAVDSHVNVLAVEDINRQLASFDIRDELRFIITVERISEDEIIGHDTIERLRVAL